MQEHCCVELSKFLAEGKVSISYSPRFREYAIDLRSSGGKQLIAFCPWCGAQLPTPLRDEWYDLVEAQVSALSGPDDLRIPEDFKSDKWWRNRDL